MKMKRKLVVLVSLIWATGNVWADADKGLEIASKIDQVNSGWKDQQVTSVMTLRAANGSEVVRHIKNRSIEVPEDGDKTLVVFEQPRDVKGTVFLTYSHKQGNDDQWLFLPALRRIKRISSANRSGPFMGSEFAYEDVTSFEVERYSYQFINEEKCAGGLTCYVFERYPLDPNSGYSKQVVYADKVHYRIHQIDYFDRKGDHLKTLTRSNYKKIDGFWRASQWEMVNHLTHKSTSLQWKDRQFGTGLDESDFDKLAMKRYR
jgi:hypothetical protein